MSDLARLTLEQTFGLEPYLEPSPRFAATGTHEGLLIVVDAGRPWFPTADAARPLPLRVLAQTPLAGAVRLAQGPVQLTGVPHP